MKALKDIIKQSKYKPQTGLKKELYRLIVEEDYNDDAIKDHFTKIGKIKQLRVVKTNLKESLLDSILVTPLYALPSLIRTRFKIWKKQVQTKILLQTNSKSAGIKLAIDTIPIAEQNDEFEVVHGLCRELINQFSTAQPNNHKYLKYRRKMQRAYVWMSEELEAETVYLDLWNAYHSKQPIEPFKAKMIALDELAKRNDKYKFRYFYYSFKSLYFQLTKNKFDLFQNNQTAFNFFQGLDRNIHYAIPFNFLSELILYAILDNDFAKSDSAILQCLEMPPIGVTNWHKILIYQCLSGFYSEKPTRALQAFKFAHSVPKKFDSEQITRNWHLIEGYLAFYTAIGRLKMDNKFKLAKWLNVTEKEGDKSQKANLIIVELLYYLADKDYTKFNNRIEQVESLIASHFKGHDFKRTRYFLRMLKAVVKGNYHPNLVTAHAATNFKKLEASASDLDVERIEREIVGYEILWGEVLGVLVKK